MAYEVVMPYHLHMPSYFLETFTEYPFSIAFGMAYGAQFLFLIGLVEGLDCNEYLAQFLGLFIYGSVNFLMNKRVTFR